MLHKKMSRTDYIVEGILLLIGIMTCICILYPIVNILAVSLSSDGYVLRHEVRVLPKGFTLQAYKDVLANGDILRSFGNSTVSYTHLCASVLIVLTGEPGRVSVWADSDGMRSGQITLCVG